MPASQHDDLEAIKQLKAKYFRFHDTKQWDSFAQVFAEEAVSCSSPDPADWKHGRQAIVEHVRSVVRDAVTVHYGHMPEIELTGDTTAKGVWSMFDFVDYGGHGWRGYGHYEEEYVKENGEWKIQSFRLTRLRKDEFKKGR